MRYWWQLLALLADDFLTHGLPCGDASRDVPSPRFSPDQSELSELRIEGGGAFAWSVPIGDGRKAVFNLHMAKKVRTWLDGQIKYLERP